jgi:hypothetical protein
MRATACRLVCRVGFGSGVTPREFAHHKVGQIREATDIRGEDGPPRNVAVAATIRS